MKTRFNFDEYQPKFSGYRSLMPKRVRNILLVSTLYDAFVLEEDGSLSEKIWSQYVGMHLTDPPAVRRVSRVARALEVIEEGKTDLVLSMTRLTDADPFAFAKEVKRKAPDLPVILLVTDPSELAMLPKPYEMRNFDKVFLWNNDPQILLAIIKLVEDLFNVNHDTRVGKVRVILLLEDSVYHYSAMLPMMYTVIMKLTRNLIDSGLNPLHRQLRMRSRAKILHAETFEQGMELYSKYKEYLLGVVSDVRFWRNGKHDGDAGFDFIRFIKKDSPYLPAVLQSVETENRQRAYDLQASFLDKNAPSLLGDLKDFLMEQMGFGDFVFRMEDQREVGRASNVYELLEKIQEVPIESLIWHAKNQHISNWLIARTEITIAEKIRPRRVEEFKTHEEVRNYISEVIADVLADKQTDVVAEFSSTRPTSASHFQFLGEGSMGGKGRGIAFTRYLAKQSDLSSRFPNIRIGVPRTLVLGAEEFDTFIRDNNLRRLALETDDFRVIAKNFMKGRIRPEVVDALRFYIQRMQNPLAIRSSSILEDSHLQPFAGLYSTYMLCNNVRSEDVRLMRLLQAVKMVWASTFGPNPKAYFKATSHRIEEEKMAVVIQEVVGKPHGNYFYPTFSGVGQSYNFYPFGSMKSEDGIAHLALGLGKMVVEGGNVFRFSPVQPSNLPQFSSPKDWLTGSQKQFYALRMDRGRALVGMDPDENLELLELSVAEQDGELENIASTFSQENGVIRDTLSIPGPRILTFSGVLKYNEFPLSEILLELLPILEQSMGCPVEIEFAVNLCKAPEKSEFGILQVRPLIAAAERDTVELEEKDLQNAWLFSPQALGNGRMDDITDIVYVKRETFDRSKMREIAEQIGDINDKMKVAGRKYILLGFGRWGSSDPWLGIGVGWAQISEARVMVEASLPNFSVEPSHGTHFFQNVTSLGVGYFTANTLRSNARIDWDWLDALPAETETEFLRHIRLSKVGGVKIDGRSGKAVCLKPEE